MVLTTKAPKPIPCSCCGDPIKVATLSQLWKEPMMGYVCDSCKMRCKTSVKILRELGLVSCEMREEREYQA